MLKFVCLALICGVSLAADSRNIYQYISDNSQYSELRKLIDSAGLKGALEQPGAITLLAPDNKAIQAVPKAVLDSFAQDNEKLKALLLYHVINQTLISPIVGDGAVLETLNGQKVTFHKNGSAIYVNNAYAPTTDVILSNGVVHELSAVLVPATDSIVQYLAKNDKMFADLFAALIVTHLEGPLDSGDFTLFAPTDAAFAKIKSGLPADTKVLADILKYHVVPGVYTSNLLKDGMQLHTLVGKDLTVKISGSRVNVGPSTVTDVDIPTTNGVIHVIDTVLVPK